MFRFVRPVRGYAALACIYVALGVAAEVLTTRQVGESVNHIKNLHTVASAAGAAGSAATTFRGWLTGADPQAVLGRGDFQGRQEIVEVGQRFAHAHDDDVGQPLTVTTVS